MSEIPIDQLVVGDIYRLRARNLTVGVWTGSTWIGLRRKFGEVFLDECEVPGRTAFALGRLGTVPEGIRLAAYLGSECQTCHRPVDFDRSRGETWQERWQHIDGPADHDARSMAVGNPALHKELLRWG
jgi:hypothetical protein